MGQEETFNAVIDEKYITFKTEELMTLLGLLIPPHHDMELVKEMIGDHYALGESRMEDAEVLAKRICGWFEEVPPIIDKIMKVIVDARLDDAVVIRRQDVFAAPALDAYANSIQVALMLDPGNEHAIRLREIADYFSEQAAKSWDNNGHPRKLPD